MRCPACSYLYFKQLDTCPKCGGALGAAQPSAQMSIDEKINPGKPAETLSASTESAPAEPAKAVEAVPGPVALVTPVSEPPETASVVESAPVEIPEPVFKPAAEPPAPVVESTPSAELSVMNAIKSETPAENPVQTAENATESKPARKRRKARELKPAEAAPESLASDPEGPASETWAMLDATHGIGTVPPPVREPRSETVVEVSSRSTELLVIPQPAAAAEVAPPVVETAGGVFVAEIPVEMPVEVPADEMSFSRVGRPEPEMPGIELRAPAPLPSEISSGQKNVEILARGVEPVLPIPSGAKPRLRVKAGKLETSNTADEAIVSEPLPATEQLGEVTFHPAAAPEAPPPLETPKPLAVSMPEPPRPEIRVKLDLQKVELPKPRPIGGEPIVPRFSRSPKPADGTVEVLPDSAYEYEFDVSNPMITDVMLDTKGAGKVLDPDAIRPAAVAKVPESNIDDTFTRLVESASPNVPADETSTPMPAESVFDPVAGEPVNQATGLSLETPAGALVENPIAPVADEYAADLDEISDNLAQRVAGEPVSEALMAGEYGKPVRSLFPEILQLDSSEENDDNDAGDDDDPMGMGGFGSLPPPSALGGEASAMLRTAVQVDQQVQLTDSSRPQAVFFEQTGEIRLTSTGSVSIPSLTPPEKRIEQIFDEITDMSQRLEGPVVPNPDPIIPFNDGRFPDAAEFDPAGEGFDGATRVSARAAEDPDQISFRLGRTGVDLTPESQLESADVLGTATGIGIRLDTPAGMGLTGKLDNWPTNAAARKKFSDRIPRPPKAWLEKLRPRISLPRQLLLKRMFSYIIDTGITVVALVMFVAVADKLTGAEFSMFHDPMAWLGRTWWVLLILKTLIEGIFYVGLMSLVGQTPGDMIMRLKIVSRDGADATPALIIRRYFWLWPFNLILPFGALTFLAGASETAYDRRAGTRVVETV